MNKSLEELQLDLIEIKAYRENQDYKDKEYYTDWWIYYVDQNEKEDNASEDAYFRMSQQNLEEAIEWYDENNSKPIKKKRKTRLNKYQTRIKYKQKLKIRKEKEWDDSSQWWKIYKTGKIITFYKYFVNQRVRTTNKKFKLVGKSYMKLFDWRRVV